MRVALIFNPRAGRGREKHLLVDRVLRALSEAGVVVDAFPTERPGHATDLAQRSRSRCDRVLAWGGDGTLNEVAAGLVGSGTPLGVLPGGTVNVFAREVGIPLALEGAVEAFLAGRVASIPVGLANGRPFLLMVGVGLDGEVVHQLKDRWKHGLGALAFWLSGFRRLAGYPMPALTVHVAGRTISCSGVVAGKLRRYGPRYFVASEAKLEEPMLHVVLFKGRHRRDYFRYLLGVVGGFHLRFADVEALKSDRITVDSEAPVPVQIDGEPAGTTPVRLEVRDRALDVVLPIEER